VRRTRHRAQQRRRTGGELDIALSNAAERAPGELIEHIHLFEDPMSAALPTGHRLVRRPKLRLRDLADEQWMLGTATTCPDARKFKRACHRAEFEPKIAFENDDYHAILSALRSCSRSVRNGSMPGQTLVYT
jgi:DNA-binding transcriptional LysR family regulator